MSRYKLTYFDIDGGRAEPIRIAFHAAGIDFADNKLTVADLRAFVQTRSLCSGILDHVPTDIVQRLAPGLFEHKERINADPRVKAYYATRS